MIKFLFGFIVYGVCASITFYLIWNTMRETDVISDCWDAEEVVTTGVASLFWPLTLWPAIGLYFAIELRKDEE